MKQLWITILDGLTFTDLAGYRHPRRYAVVAGVILFISLLLASMSLVNRILLSHLMEGTHTPVSGTGVPATPTLPTEPTTIICPVNAEEWSLGDVVISQNYKTIQPACVYDGLAHTVAWALAVRNGYSRGQARELLGFDEMPMRQLSQVKILTDTKGPKDVDVGFTPPTPDLIEWRVGDNGEPAVTYALRGCFRTSSVVGNQVEVWGGEYPVICVVVEDAENTRIMYNLGEHYYTAPAIPMRSFLLFGYIGNGYWVWLGTQTNPKTTIHDFAKMADERRTVAALFDSQPWDTLWLEQRYGMTQQPLPENWRSFTDPSEQQAIVNGLITDWESPAP
ncbi:MAG: hypothetical protein ACOYZ8_13125 [Chloroflexota bacterium]